MKLKQSNLVIQSNHGSPVMFIRWNALTSTFTGETLAAVHYEDYSWEYKTHKMLHLAGYQ